MNRHGGKSVRVDLLVASAKRGVVLGVLAAALLLLGAAPVCAVTTVSFPDPALEAVVRSALGIPVAPITDEDMRTLTMLTGDNANITNLTGLEYATNLNGLYLSDNQITDISALSGMTNLYWFLAYNNQIEDISVLAGLTKLNTIGLADNQVADIEPLRNLANLDSLFMHKNRISDISPLAGLTKLRYLYVDYNFLDITPGSPAMDVINQQLGLGVTVHYSPQKPYYTITPSAGPHGTITPGVRQFLDPAGSVSFTITPETGYRVADVLVDDASVGAVTIYPFSDVNANHTIAAEFAPDTYAIAYNLNGGANPGGAPTGYTYGVGAVLPVPTRGGYTFGGWYTTAGLTGSPVSAILASDVGAKTFWAKWTPITFQITALAVTHGTLAPAGVTTVNAGGSRTYSITPSTGYVVADVLVDGKSVGAVLIYTFSKVSANHTISARFAAKTTTVLSGPTSAPAYAGTARLAARLRRFDGVGLSGKTLIFERRSGTGWVSVGTATTDANGSAVKYVGGLLTRQVYRARFVGAPSLNKSTSSSIAVSPRVRLTRSTSWSSLEEDKAYYARGYIEPRHDSTDPNKVEIRAYKKGSDGKYRYVKSFTAEYAYYGSSKSKYSAKVVLPSKGYWRLRAYHAADNRNAASWGTSDYVKAE